jgi:hypothetical protein
MDPNTGVASYTAGSGHCPLFEQTEVLVFAGRTTQVRFGKVDHYLSQNLCPPAETPDSSRCGGLPIQPFRISEATLDLYDTLSFDSCMKFPDD